MVNKTKNRVRPRSRLLVGLFVLVGLSAVIAVAVISNFKTKQGYFVYEARVEGYLNLYVYDVATEEVRPITDSGSTSYHFVTARNAPLVAYFEWSEIPSYPLNLMLYNARTGHTEQVATNVVHMSLHPDGDFLVYDHITPDIFSDDFDPEEFDVIRAETRLLDLRTGEEQVVYSRRNDQYTLIGDYQWTEESLIFSLIDTLYEIYDPITFRYPLDGSSEVESIDHSDLRYSMFHMIYHLTFAPDESRVIYPLGLSLLSIIKSRNTWIT